ncbi:hypothetical protein KAZ57_04170, partial [Patescibacteria group bacterium]|nr:hypothetical protein [Patescibacteria group bacterium]
LYARVDSWVDLIWGGGLVDEVVDLTQQGYSDAPQMKGLVYKTVQLFLQKELTSEQAVQRIKYDLHAYIRRQQTYFRALERRVAQYDFKSSMTWLDISEDNFLQKVYNTLNG